MDERGQEALGRVRLIDNVGAHQGRIVVERRQNHLRARAHNRHVA